MKKILIGLLLPFAFTMPASGTKVVSKPLKDLVQQSDHILVATVQRVQMVDGSGKEIKDLKARTGPGLPNELRLHIKVLKKDGVINTNAAKLPEKLVIPLWKMRHLSLGSTKELHQGKSYIFLLKGAGFARVYPGSFMQQPKKHKEIERLLKQKKPQKKPKE